MPFDRFRKGHGTFYCTKCNKLTRDTTGINVDMCKQCIENCEKHNYYVDSNKEKECDCIDCKKGD